MVIDSAAVMAILNDEPEPRSFNEAIEKAEFCLMSAASFVEASIEHARAMKMCEILTYLWRASGSSWQRWMRSKPRQPGWHSASSARAATRPV